MMVLSQGYFRIVTSLTGLLLSTPLNIHGAGDLIWHLLNKFKGVFN